MDVVSICPLPVAKLFWQSQPGAFRLTVICKATFLLQPGTAKLSPDQEKPNEDDNHWNDDARRSLYAGSDLAPFKPRADVILAGHAFAPGGSSVRSLVARLRVGTIDKAIEVFCERVFRPDGTLDEGAPFLRMPLVYERAAGGAETANPVGMRVDAVDPYGRIAVPNLQPPGRRTTSVLTDRIEPVGFGPIAPTWPPRRDRVGRRGGVLSSRDIAQKPLPEDLEPAYFNVAPPDQQLDELRDNELIVLENLHPEHARLHTQLPGLRPLAVLERPGRAPYPFQLRGDTLWIDTDRARCTLTWRGQVPLEQPDEQGRIVVSMEGAQGLDGRNERRASGPAQAAEPTPLAARHPDTLVPPPSPGAVSDEETPSSATGRYTAPRAVPVLPFAPAPELAGYALRVDRQNKPSGGLPFMPPPALPGNSGRSGELPPSWAATSAVRPVGAESAVYQASVPTPAPPLPPPPALPALAAAPASPALAASPASPAPAASTVESSPWASRGAPATPPSSAAPVGLAAAVSVQTERSGGSVLGASNAAAAPFSSTARPSRTDSPPARSSKSSPAPRLAPREGELRVVELLWFEPASVPRIRRKPPWRSLVAKLEDRPLDAELDDPALVKEPTEIEDRREVFEVIALGEAAPAEAVNEALAGGVREDGKFVPVLSLFAGELHFPFDELATLRATLTTVTPIVGNDENLKAAVEVAKDFLKTPGLASAPAVAEGLTTRIKDAFGQGKRVVPAGYLEAQTERALLDQRHYQRRSVFGGTHLRALLQVPAGAAAIPVYLKEELSTKLPLYQRFKVRMIVEVHLSADQYEPHPAALRVVALGRVAASPKA
jgi:hypothetical protein